MNYDEILGILANSGRHDWAYVPCHGDGGPSYDVKWEQSGNDFAPQLHPHRATYRGNVNLTIAWGMAIEEDASRTWLAEGIRSAIKGKETTADFEYIDVFWAGAVILRRHYFAISSEHVWIPAFERAGEQFVVPESEVSFLETVVSLEAGDPLNKLYTTRSALEKIGVQIVDG